MLDPAFLRRLLPVSAFFSVFAQGVAHAVCIEPSKPTCVDRLSVHSDKFSIKNCRREIERFLAEVEPWLECTRLEKEKDADEAIQRFRCVVQGEEHCP